jgi:hypothetical protein
VYRQLRLAAGILKWLTIIQLARVIGMFRSPRQIISAWPAGAPTLTPRVAVFMHFDRKGRVSAPAMNYMKELVANGFCVVFVTNSGMLTQAAQTQLREVCAAVFVRRNIGYDFGAWRDVIDALKLPAANTCELLLVNDSMYGPLRPLAATLARMDYAAADIWGLTESWQQRYHLQSFFIGFGENALQSPAFRKFWRQVQPVPAKGFIIRVYEVGLTQVMLRAGLRLKAVWPYEELVAQVTGQNVLDDIARAERFKTARNDPVLITRKLQIHRIRDSAARQIALNPTADLWRQLLLSGFPFIKRELVRRNPSQVEDLGDWVRVVRNELGLDPEPILSELRGGLKNRAP